MPTRTILHPQLEVNAVTDFHTIPTSLFHRTQAKKSISRQTVCLSDYRTCLCKSMFFNLCPGTYTFGYCVKICYCINFKLWMKYCACCHCDDILLGVLITIPISVYLHRKNIFCFNNQFPSSYSFSVNCCVILKCI